MADGEKSTREVFIVDDEAHIRRVFTRFLERTHETVQGINSSNLTISEVIDLLRVRLTMGSLLLLDGRYSDGEAGDLIAGLSPHLHEKGSSVFVMTSDPSIADNSRRRFPQVPALLKPFDVNVLVDMLKSCRPFQLEDGQSLSSSL